MTRVRTLASLLVLVGVALVPLVASTPAGASTTVPDPTAGGWQLNGSASIAGGGLQLTPAAAQQAGSGFWPTAVPSASLSVAFDATIDSGNGADGMTLALLDPASSSPTGLGAPGGGEGFSGLTGTAVSLDTYKNANDPSNNFVGVASGGVADALTYVATAPAPGPLVNATHHVVLTVASGHLKVSVDGNALLDVVRSLPANVLVGFTAGTGGLYDRHLVSHVVVGSTTSPPSVSGNFPTYLFNNARTGYEPAEKTLTTSNVGTLHPHWIRSGSATVSGQPVVGGGRLYWGDWDGYEHATDANGNDIWRAFIGTTTAPGCSPSKLGVASTPTLVTLGSTPALLVGGGDAQYYALNTATGAILWRYRIGPSPANFAWSSPAVFNGHVYVGVASVGDCPLVQGKVLQLDATSGMLQHEFDAVPASCVGGGVWTSPTVDQSAGVVYVTSGTPTNCATGQGYMDAMIALRASDLTPLDSWRLPGSEEIYNSDWGGTPTLFSATIGGVVTSMVGAVHKNGTYYAFKRGAVGQGPLWRAAIAPNTGDCPQCGLGSIAPSAWDGTTLYAAGGTTTIAGVSCAGSVQALDPATGAARWQRCLNGPVLGAVTAVPGLVVVGAGPSVVVLSSATGRVLYTWTDPSGQQFYGPASIAGGIAYAGNVDGKVVALGL